MDITYAKNLSKQNFNSIVNFQIDSKVNVKTILNVSCYMFDEKIESASGKAVVSGKLGVKVLYVDTDNITNTLTETQPFSETILDNSITNDCFINLTNISCLCEEISSESSLKVGCNISFVPIVYLKLAMPNNIELNDKTICKNSTFTTNTIANKIDTSFNYTTTLETQNEISKILNFESNFCLTEITAQDGYAIVEGKLFSSLIYETIENEETKIKKLCDTFNIKTDVEIENLTKDTILDVEIRVDSSQTKISTEIEDGSNVVTISNVINIKGVELKEISMDIIEDLYSTSNELEVVKSSRECVCETQKHCVKEEIVGEVSLNKEESAIEDIVANQNVNYEITNVYIKNGVLQFEGIITSSVIYVDEAKEFKRKIVELPFVINTKLETETLPTNHIEMFVSTEKVKARRGTIIEIEYSVEVCACLYKTTNKEFIDNINVGKVLDFSQYDYQIFIAKQNETLWDLGKRTKCQPDELTKYNKNLPISFNGGEKIIIKR